MRKFILSISALFIITLSYAQGSSKSKSILDNVSQQYQKSEGIKIIFTINTKEIDGAQYEPQPGTAFVKGDKFKLVLPYATTWFDGTTQWVLLKDANEVNINNPAEKDLASISPIALLNMYKRGYILKEPISKSLNGQDVFVIEMTTVQKFQEIKNISIAINKKTNAITELSFFTNNNIESRLRISEFTINEKYPDELFSFNKLNHPGVEIIDLR